MFEWLTRELFQVITLFQAHILPISSVYSVNKNSRRVHAIVVRRNREEKLLISIENGIITELISDMVNTVILSYVILTR